MKKDILVVFGGASPEYYVSCRSGADVIGAISREKYNVHCLGITQDGQWLLTEATPAEISDGETWLSCNNRPAILSPDRVNPGLLILDCNTYKRQRIDVVFPIIHGDTGEDGKIQGLLEIAGIPYVGSGVCASACSMDKSVTMIFAEHCGVRCPEYFACDGQEYLKDPKGVAESILGYFEDCLPEVFPLFVKPASTGSSVGISKVSCVEEMDAALKIAAQYPGRLIIEEGIVGREVKVAVLGNRELLVGEICECVVDHGVFNDFDLKYKGAGSHKKIPADLPEDTVEELKRSARKIYACLGCSGFARVDFFVRNSDGAIVFNEINTVPGLTAKSIYSLMFDKTGIPYEELIEKLINLGLEDEE